ncbi:membrane hypothetical protein [Syntrophobacter sp. SbD1]|nr:membrane hypothetical protein [Syntrophobacter sp. SbD1]
MIAFFNSTLKCILKGRAAVFSGSLEQYKYQNFRESLIRGCFYLFTPIYALMTLITIIYPIHEVPIKWTWAEFLINYQGGFVRRGLLGEILFQLQPVIPGVVAASIIVFFCYCLFTYFALKLLSDIPLVVFAFFVFSPSGFLFPVYEPAVFARKEIFSFLAFTLVILTYIKYSDYRVKVCSFLVLYTIATLINDAAVLFAPLAACLLVLSMREEKKHLRVTVLCALLFYVVALGSVIFFSINPHYDPSGIVKSWSPYFPNIGTGPALDYLNKGLGTYLTETSHKAASWNLFTGPFLVDFCLAFLPIILLLLHSTHLKFFRTLRTNEPLLFLSTIGSLLAPLILFCCQDWGRWIYIISMHTFIFLSTLENFGLVAYKEIPAMSKYQWKICALFFLYYVILWRMPHLRLYGERW